MLAQAIPADHIVFGSDYPHAEGLAHPADYRAKAEKLGPEKAAWIMGENAAKLVGAW